MSLYNEVRPKTLSEVVGQANIKAQLTALVSSGNIPNALLLTGPRGTGKTTVARIIARTLNCEKGKDEPCCECQTCKDILNGTSMDVIELDAASNNSVEDVRTIVEKAQYSAMSKYKVFILDEVHMFSSGAWNALLKTLEEPPKNVIFILCTTEEHKVPATIISRCRKLMFEKIELATISSYLASICDEHGRAYEDDALKLIAQASDGCMRDALSIMESFFYNDTLVTDIVASTLGLAEEDAVFGILKSISLGDFTTALNIVREQSRRGKNLKLLVKTLVSAVTDTLFVLSGTDVSSIINTFKYKSLLKEYSSITDTTRCLELTSLLTDVYGSISKVPDALFLIESALLKAVHYESSLASLEERVKTLEERSLSENSQMTKETASVVSFPTQAAALGNNFAQGNCESIPDFMEHIKECGVSTEIDDVTDESIGMEQVHDDVDNTIPFEEDVIPNNYISDSSSQNDSYLPAPSVEKNGSSKSSDMNDLLAHLPKGTKIKGIKSMEELENTEPASLDTDIEAATSVGKAQSLVSNDTSLPSMGFVGFSDWL